MLSDSEVAASFSRLVGLRRGDARERALPRRDHAAPQHGPVPTLALAVLAFPAVGDARALLRRLQERAQRLTQRGIVRGAHGVLRALHLRDERAGHAELGDSLAGVAGDVLAVALLDERV